MLPPEHNDKRSMFARIMELNEPKSYVVFGLLGCLIAGSAQPSFAVLFSGVINYLTIPFKAIPWVFAGEISPSQEPTDFLSEQLSSTVLLMIVGGFTLMAAIFVKRYTLGMVSETVTFKVR